MKRGTKIGDTKVVASAGLVLEGSDRRRGLKQILPFMGPAFIASVAYIDPGNFATNIQGGAQFGYTLLWVVVASNLMAMLLQTLSAKLGIATGTNLAEHCRNQFPRRVVWLMWGVMEVVSMATDLAEFLGGGARLLPAVRSSVVGRGCADRDHYPSDPCTGDVRFSAVGGGHHGDGRRHRASVT